MLDGAIVGSGARVAIWQSLLVRIGARRLHCSVRGGFFREKVTFVPSRPEAHRDRALVLAHDFEQNGAWRPRRIGKPAPRSQPRPARPVGARRSAPSWLPQPYGLPRPEADHGLATLVQLLCESVQCLASPPSRVCRVRLVVLSSERLPSARSESTGTATR